jgi:beta-phosphoglucomutase-like phosphatase (HAD superfamily)
VKKYVLFDHDGVLVDTEFWYYKAGERALADIGFTLDRDQYLRDMTQGLATWAQARAAGIDEQTISRQRQIRNVYYQEYLRTETIEIEGVVETLDWPPLASCCTSSVHSSRTCGWDPASSSDGHSSSLP